MVFFCNSILKISKKLTGAQLKHHEIVFKRDAIYNSTGKTINYINFVLCHFRCLPKNCIHAEYLNIAQNPRIIIYNTFLPDVHQVSMTYCTWNLSIHCEVRIRA